MNWQGTKPRSWFSRSRTSQDSESFLISICQGVWIFWTERTRMGKALVNCEGLCQFEVCFLSHCCFTLKNKEGHSFTTQLWPCVNSGFFFFFFCGTGAWTQNLHVEPFHQPYFCEGFFEIGSQALFAWTGFKPRSSWSLPPEYLGLQAWATGARQILYR
jgi:hypothetical protein